MTYPIPRASIWPNVVFDTSSPSGMAEAQKWLEDLYSDWLASLPAISTDEAQRRMDAVIAAKAPESPVEPRDGANSTQGPPETNRSAETVLEIARFMRSVSEVGGPLDHARLNRWAQRIISAVFDQTTTEDPSQ